jgi:hypothetical protein
MKRELREFNPERLIAELQDFALDYKRGDFSKYRVTHIDRAPEMRDLGQAAEQKASAQLRRK